MTVPGPPTRTARNHGSRKTVRPAGTVATGADGPVEPKGGGLSTPGLLNAVRILIILALLGSALVGVISLQNRGEDLRNIELQAARVLRLESIKTEILRADGLATNGLAQGAAEPSSQREEYRLHLNQAAMLTVEAGRDGAIEGADLSLELGKANAALLQYATTIELARVLMPTDPVRANELIDEADQALNNDAIAALNNVINANRQLLDEARAMSSTGIVALAAIPVVLIVLVSIAVARRTRRIINIGLVVALLTAIGSWWMQQHAITSTNDMISTAKSSQLQEALASSRAFSELSAAKSVEGHQLVQTDRVDGLNGVWTVYISSAKQEIASLADPATHTTAVDAYTAAHNRIVEVVKGGDKAALAAAAGDTGPDSVNATYDRALDGLQTQARSTRAELGGIMTNQSERLSTFSAFAAALGIIGALAVGFGLGARIKEYR